MDPFVFTEERNCDTIKLLDGDNETVLYTLGEYELKSGCYL